MGNAHGRKAAPPARSAVAGPRSSTGPVHGRSGPAAPRTPADPPTRRAPPPNHQASPQTPTAAWQQAVTRPTEFKARRSKVELEQPVATLASNAPPEWPRVNAPRAFLDRRGIEHGRRFLKGVRSSLERAGLEVVAQPQRRLVKDGVLEIHLLVLDHGREVPVFVYPRMDAKCAAHFLGAQRLLKAMGAPSPVYYADAPLPRTPAADPCVPLRLHHLSPAQEEPLGTFAMWWATPADKDFLLSTCHRSIRRYYEAIDGRESYLYARLLDALAGGGMKMPRAALPHAEERLRVAVDGPGDRTLYVTADRVQGIRFHFDRDATPAWYRDAFWRYLADLAETLRDEVLETGGHKDSYYEDRPLRWLETLEKAIAKGGTGAHPKKRLVGGLVLA